MLYYAQVIVDEDKMMQRIVSNFRFMLLWLPGMAFALIASLCSFVTIFFAGSLIAFYIWGEEINKVTPTMASIYMLILYSMMGVALGLLFGSTQKALLRQKTDEPWCGWTTASTIGATIGVVATIYLVGQKLVEWSVYHAQLPLFAIMLITTVPFACMGLAQMFVLRRYVGGAWTWVLANVVSGVVIFSLLMSGIFDIGSTPLLRLAVILIMSMAPGIVTGFAMLWLLNFNWKHEYLEF